MATTSTSLELTVRGRVVAGLGALAAVAGWLAGDANARLAAALLLAPLLLDVVLRPRGLQRTVVRVGARRTVAGAPFSERVTVQVPGRTPLRECLVLETRTNRIDPPTLVPLLPPGQPTTVILRGRSLQRSHVLERVFLLVSAWPFGLFRSRTVVAVAAELVTEPARVPLAAELLPALAEREASPRDRTTLPGPEFHSLREHEPGADARSVHALRSAALGTLVQRVTQGRLPRTVGLVLDLRRPPGRPLQQGGRRFEWSLSATASLLHHLRERGAEVDVLLLDAEPLRLLVQGPAAERELLTLLAEASPTPHRPVPDDLFRHLQRLEQCYWVPAGSYLAGNEHTACRGKVTLVGGVLE